MSPVSQREAGVFFQNTRAGALGRAWDRCPLRLEPSLEGCVGAGMAKELGRGRSSRLGHPP